MIIGENLVELAPSDWAMVAFTFGVLWFVLDYGIFNPWWRAPIGWVVMIYGFSVLLLMFLILYGLVAGQRVDEWARLPVGVLLVAGILGKIVILHVARHEGRIERRRLRAERHARLSEVRNAEMVDREPPASFLSAQSAPKTLPSATRASEKRKVRQMIINKYLAGLLTVLVVAVTAFQAALSDGFTTTEAWQLSGLVLGAFVTVFVPLLQGKWAAGLKVGGAVLGAAIAAIVPFATGGWDASAVTIVVLAILNTLTTQMGVDVRIDSAKQALADPSVSIEVPHNVDPVAMKIAGPPTEAPALSQ
ncbi:membrane protein [Microbacterium phage Hendrix]|uniref:Uncharacterized protein n=1 Tax=Microbacterium phage Hendrix TaxID=2182341 RepID=A0A2U8UU81_9CAUD|nr:membrane protein [Microbacterium phage Hendrix]AWN07751.1 hypothetical protein PBI_HENDRIX_80 [Microbacterium phage Hendrix]